MNRRVAKLGSDGGVRARAANKKQESSGRRRVVAKGRASLTGSRSGDMRGCTSQTVSNRTEREKREGKERLLR